MNLSSLFFTLTLIILFTFALQRKHFLMSLLSLEAIILSLTIMTVYSFGLSSQFNTFLFIILLTFGACEASLGLSLLVSMMRYFGNDSINSMTTNKC